MKLDIEERVLHFKQPAGTSRGVYTTRRIWLITATDEVGRVTGVGECAPLPQLSCDDIPNYAEVLSRFCDEVERTGVIPYEALRPYPSMLFGLESLVPTPIPSRGEGSLDTLSPAKTNQAPLPSEGGGGGFFIPINGLVWMGTFEEMHQRIEEKLAAGFHCVKLKIGAIDWDREIALIRFIRERYSREQIELRVDANGGFSVDEAMSRLEELAKYDIHSIEQPIRQHQWSEMASLCQHSPLPIALDEELIGVNDPAEKVRLLDTIRPQYIILKPSLHGGMRGSEEWIRLARERGIGSWITSALESNIGLYAIARFTMKMYGPDITMPQGLGTGQLFTDNIELPDVEMRIEQGRLVVAASSGAAFKALRAGKALKRV
ncbi:MAG: o-succinylbenzoate synthase [Prevotella sp.]|nr:o-succinylbenzoate synthase [Prevotella sp.]